jgi:NADH-quinone oxidoreductase subunit E
VPFTPANRDLARETIAKYPQKKSAVLPLLHLAQDQDGHVTPEAMEEIADLLDHLQRRYAADGDVTVEEVECIAACDLAPVLQVNYEFHGPIAGPDAETLIDEYKAGKRVARTISGTKVRS